MSEIKRLEQKSRKYTMSKAPSMPDHAIVVRRYCDKTANGLTKCILPWLRIHDCQAEIQKNRDKKCDPYLLLREDHDDDPKFNPFMRSCRIEKLANAYYKGYSPSVDFEIYDRGFTERHLKTINGRKIWTL